MLCIRLHSANHATEVVSKECHHARSLLQVWLCSELFVRCALSYGASFRTCWTGLSRIVFSCDLTLRHKRDSVLHEKLSNTSSKANVMGCSARAHTSYPTQNIFYNTAMHLRSSCAHVPLDLDAVPQNIFAFCTCGRRFCPEPSKVTTMKPFQSELTHQVLS